MTTTLIKSLRPTYARIDLDRLASNISIAKQMSGSEIIAVIKADAYGHGADKTGQYAYKCCDVRNFAVATISEGMSLRKILNDSSVRLIVLGYVDSLFYGEVTTHNLQLTIFDEQIALSYHKYLTEMDLTAHIVLKVDSGMGRLGFPLSMNLEDFCKRYPRFEISHVMSHFSCSDTDEAYTKRQENSFIKFINQPCPHKFDTSLYNSSAVANYGNLFRYTRLGLFLYGYVDGAKHTQPALKPVMNIFSKVVHINKLSKGQTVSYGNTYTADKDCWAGVVPIGYADGYCRSFSNKAFMVIDGVRCPVIGTVCMDMTLIDVSHFGENAYLKEVEVLGDNVTATELAGIAGTIEYEILCGISDRIPRIYTS